MSVSRVGCSGSNEEAERVFAALSTGGEVLMALTETFFAHRFRAAAGPLRHELDDPVREADAERLTGTCSASLRTALQKGGDPTGLRGRPTL